MSRCLSFVADCSDLTHAILITEGRSRTVLLVEMHPKFG